MNDREKNNPAPGIFDQLSKNDFSRAYTKRFWRSLSAWIQNKNNELLPFEQVLQHMPMRGQHYAGLKQIETDKIIGSVSRFQEFDRVFLPRQTHTRSRWESIDRAYFQDIILPPIEVYKVGKVYFVKDGNHRVSVARERGQMYMDAYVTDFDTPGKVDENSSISSLLIEHEYAEFIQQTKLDRLFPGENFRFSTVGQYGKLLQHISVHRWFMGEKLGRPVSDEEAVIGWYTEVYKPLIKIIRKHNIMKEFPNRTETDLYLWIIEHRWFLGEELHRRVSLESAALHFAQTVPSSRPFRHLQQIVAWIKKKIPGNRNKK